jgi:hypothetical protein
MASSRNEECVVEYAPWRAVTALMFPTIVFSIPLINYLYDSQDFKERYVDQPISTAGMLVALVWFLYVAWPGFKQLKSGTQVSIFNNSLQTADGRVFSLQRLREISIEPQFLRHPRIRARFSDPFEEAVIATAFQSLETKKSADEIIELIRRRAKTGML